jgi:HEAT repeat protein
LNFNQWKALLLSDDEADRANAADELPVDGDDEEVEILLTIALRDEDPFVRACAVDSQKAFDTERSRNAVREFLKVEEDALARAFAISTMGAIGDIADLTLLSQAFVESSSDQRVRNHCSSAVIELVLRTHLRHLIKESEVLDDHQEREMRSAVNLLADAAEHIRCSLTEIQRWAQRHPSLEASPIYQQALRRIGSR